MVFVPLLTAIIIFPLGAALLCGLLTYGLFGLSRPPSSLAKALFNVGQCVASVAVAGGIYHGLVEVLPDHSAVPVIALFAAASCLAIANQIFVAVYLALQGGQAVRKTLKGLVSSVGFVDDLIVSPLALIAAAFYRDAGLAGLAAILVSLLLVRHAYDARMKVQRGMEDLLRVLVKTLETRDRYTSGHSVRVSVLARSIAEDLGLRPRQVRQVEMAALVHDIGKIEEVYAEIIQKPHALTEVEKLVIKTHATRGADFLRGLSSFPEDVILGVRHHHERFDGTGYPDGMASENIPLIARIIMICDSVDAMLSDRPYRKALSIEAVRSELSRCRGAQFDPKLVEVMLAKGTLERAVGLLKDAYPAREEEQAMVIEAAHRFK